MKLIKNGFDGWAHYYLKNDNGDTIGTTKHPFQPETLLMAKGKGIELMKLSHKNCEYVERGYDLGELISDEIDKLPYEKHLDDGQYNDGQRVGFELGAYWGFLKSIELNGNKKYTIKEVVELTKILLSNPFEKCGKTYEELVDSYTKSLEKSEWDVQIVGELDDGCVVLKKL